ncbi:hypothetical protein [Methylobacterium brachiatum]|uniref:hypothetical protein n=1 Tax=Methylobacterium brachiatum TaxID=269660 RepID=UPI0008EA3496|nr:hypothetical protein [Methylobacterium brachiatum]SFJ68160.1 hypothetical protein SAMN02799642_05156 [Methylobacterium brachiatum]
MATVGQAAAHVFLAERNFYELLDRGVVERQPAGEYDLEIVREEVIRQLRAAASGREKKPGALDGEFEKARKDKELADRTALQNAVTRGELVAIEEIGKQVEREYAVVRERLLGISGKLGADLTPEQVARIEAEIRDALEELHDPGDIAERIHQPGGEAEEGEDEFEAAAPARPGRVG